MSKANQVVAMRRALAQQGEKRRNVLTRVQKRLDVVLLHTQHNDLECPWVKSDGKEACAAPCPRALLLELVNELYAEAQNRAPRRSKT